MSISTAREAHPTSFGVMKEKTPYQASSDATDSELNVGEVETAGSEHLHRKLRGTQVQLFAIGGAIGTSLFVQMASILPKAGPGGLFIGFLLWGTVMWAVNECFAGE